MSKFKGNGEPALAWVAKGPNGLIWLATARAKPGKTKKAIEDITGDTWSELSADGWKIVHVVLKETGKIAE